MSKVLAAVALTVLLFPVAGHAQAGRGAPPPRQAAGHGIDVPGWWARMDNPRAVIGSLKFTSEGSVLHAVSGPASILWDPQQTASGEYTVKAKFTLSRMPRFEEGYGLFIGGANLDKDNERFTAFLVREDGSYAIRQRRGLPNAGATVNWTSDPALTLPDASRRETNELAIHVGKDDVTFMVNGKVVTKRPGSAIDTDGVVGLRVNDNLDVRVEGFSVEKEKSPATR